MRSVTLSVSCIRRLASRPGRGCRPPARRLPFPGAGRAGHRAITRASASYGRHEDIAVLRKGHNDAYLLHEFELLKWIGANSFRTSHYLYVETCWTSPTGKGSCSSTGVEARVRRTRADRPYRRRCRRADVELRRLRHDVREQQRGWLYPRPATEGRRPRTAPLAGRQPASAKICEDNQSRLNQTRRWCRSSISPT